MRFPGGHASASLAFSCCLCPAYKLQEIAAHSDARQGRLYGNGWMSCPFLPMSGWTHRKVYLCPQDIEQEGEKTGTEKCLFSHLLLLTFPPSMWYSKMWNQSSGSHHCTRGRGLRRILFPRSVCTPRPVTLRWRPNCTLDWESPANQSVQYLGPNSGCGLEMKWGACRQRIYWRAPWILF